jgi:hypothetical protein
VNITVAGKKKDMCTVKNHIKRKEKRSFVSGIALILKN